MPRFVIKQDRQINGNSRTVFWLPFLGVFVFFSSFHQLIEYADFFDCIISCAESILDLLIVAFNQTKSLFFSIKKKGNLYTFEKRNKKVQQKPKNK